MSTNNIFIDAIYQAPPVSARQYARDYLAQRNRADTAPVAAVDAQAEAVTSNEHPAPLKPAVARLRELWRLFDPHVDERPGGQDARRMSEQGLLTGQPAGGPQRSGKLRL